MLVSIESLRAEETRVQQAYAKRRSGYLYSRSNPAYLLEVQERERRLLKLLARHGCEFLDQKKILEIGCGTGDLLRDFVKWGAGPENVTGIDVLAERVCEAVHLCPTNMRIERGNAANLDFANEQFDLVLQSTLFTSVLDLQIKKQIALEMLRVVKADGLLLWYDYHVNNPRNSDVRGVSKREIHQLFPNCRIELKKITLAPPLARPLAPYSWLLCYLLGKLPLLCTHYLGVIQKKNNRSSSG